MKYEIDIHFFKEKLTSLMIKKGMIDSKGKPDKIQLYNLLYPSDKITAEFCKLDRQGVTDKTRNISNWLSGKNYPKDIKRILEICNALECDLDYFFTDMEAPTHDLAFIKKEIGLSVDSVLYLRSATNYERLTLDVLLSQGYFKDICLAIYSYMQTLYKDMNIEDKDTNEIQNIQDSEKLEIAEYRASKHFSNLLINKLANNKDIQNYNYNEHTLEVLIHGMNAIKSWMDAVGYQSIEKKLWTKAREKGLSFNDICNLSSAEWEAMIREELQNEIT